MNRAPSSDPSPPVGEKVPAGRWRGTRKASRSPVHVRSWWSKLPMNRLVRCPPFRVSGGAENTLKGGHQTPGSGARSRLGPSLSGCLLPLRTALLCLLVAGLQGAARSAPAPAPVSPGAVGAPAVALLDYSEADTRLLSRFTAVLLRTEPFRKEPLQQKGPILRGTLELGGGPSNSISLLWQQQAGRLYLDLNRNLDLTDDPAGVLAAATNQDSQVFTNVRLPLKTASGVHRFKLDLTLNTYGRGFLYANVGLESCWRGQFSWQGQELELAVVEGPWEGPDTSQGPFLVLRPWALRNTPIGLEGGSAEAVPLPTKLFWGELACRVARRYETVGTTERCRLEFTEERPALGELRLHGSFLNRVTLDDSHGYTAVLDRPTASTRIPLGTYKVSEVWVKKDTTEAVQSSPRQVTVTEKSPALLVAGGPLTNSVTANRRGKRLVLSYQLIGADGGPYRLQKDDQQTPPQVSIQANGRQVASGKFAYG
jgi:hypothetical protein